MSSNASAASLPSGPADFDARGHILHLLGELSQADLGTLLLHTPTEHRDGLCRALEALVNAGDVSLGFDGNAVGLAQTVFHLRAETTGPRFAPAGSVRYEAVDALLRHVHNQRDSRLEALGWSTLPYAVAALAPPYSAQQVCQAFSDAFAEGTLKMFCHASNQFVAFAYSSASYFTVLGHIEDASETLCFHVRAGSPAKALEKIEASPFGRETLDMHEETLHLQGITEGRLTLTPVEGHFRMQRENL